VVKANIGQTDNSHASQGAVAVYKKPAARTHVKLEQTEGMECVLTKLEMTSQKIRPKWMGRRE
jgi:hypothetical protein